MSHLFKAYPSFVQVGPKVRRRKLRWKEEAARRKATLLHMAEAFP